MAQPDRLSPIDYDKWLAAQQKGVARDRAIAIRTRQMLDTIPPELLNELDLDANAWEEKFRSVLHSELGLALWHQDRFFHQTESPLAKQSDAVIELTASLLTRLRDSDEKITSRYVVNFTEAHISAEFLEAVRRTSLRSLYILHPGFNNGGIENTVSTYNPNDIESLTQKLATPAMKNVYGDEFFRLEDARVTEEIQNRGEIDWQEALQKEGMYLKEYLEGYTQRAARKSAIYLDFLSRLTKNGQRVHTDGELQDLATKVGDLEQIALEIKQIPDFSGILPWIHTRFGPQSNFETFLEYVSPKDKKQKQQPSVYYNNNDGSIEDDYNEYDKIGTPQKLGPRKFKPSR